MPLIYPYPLKTKIFRKETKTMKTLLEKMHKVGPTEVVQPETSHTNLSARCNPPCNCRCNCSP